MWEYLLVHKMRVLVGSMVMLAGFLLLGFLVSTASNGSWRGSNVSVYSGSAYSSPNAVTGALSGVGNAFMGAITATGDAFSRSGTAVERAFDHGPGGAVVAVGKGIGSGVVAGAKGVGSGVAWMGRGIGSGFAVMFRATGVVARATMFNPHAAASIIRPADHTAVPIIEPDSPALLAASKALPAAPAAAAPTPTVPAPQPVLVPKWPLHGAVTTEFGASNWPYQRVHTGIDISDGTRPGTTPIYPFRPGTVVQVVHSNVSLGNHVVVDHGNGVTSVYAHMSSTSVVVGQQVDHGTVLGYEGSTGASTGTHLHLEIRVNGQAANPRTFISGQP